MKLRLASPSHIIDLNKIEGLSDIEMKGRALVIGAMTRHADVAASPVVRQAIPALADLAHMIGDPAVRHRGTIGGSVANNDPNADYPAACLGLGATITTTKRKIVADDFFKGLFETALEPDEIITKVTLPDARRRPAYQKFRNPASRFALVGVFVAKRPSEIRVAVTGAGALRRVPRARLRGGAQEAVLAEVARRHDDPGGRTWPADIHGSAEYRAHLVGVLRPPRRRSRFGVSSTVIPAARIADSRGPEIPGSRLVRVGARSASGSSSCGEPPLE